mgnify:CR=1 FL=1
MTFKEKKIIPKRTIYKSNTKKTNYNSKNSSWKSIWGILVTILMYLILLWILTWALWAFYVYNKYLVDLPSIKELENLEISESSVIYDREWNELYKIFKEKRTYKQFEDINENMVNALIAIEDKRYWTNPGVDIKWLARAGINYALWKTSEVKWTSTLTQQLIRNTIIKNERSIERKIKEIYLAYKLTSTVSKEKILEIYLNKISFWHNAFGIEEAAKTFFNKSASNLEILESSILASLPKWPTYYSPYNHPDRILGYTYIYTDENEDDIIKLLTKKEIEENKEVVSSFTDIIKDLKMSRLEWTNKVLICNIKQDYFKNNLSIDNDWCTILVYSKLLSFLNSFKLKTDRTYLEYQTWRKDQVLTRMLEDEYITLEEYKESIINSIWFKFHQRKENIKSPHFVFYVKEYLEEKFGQEIASLSWLKIYTTLDPKLQKKAIEAVEKQAKINDEEINAKNAALISIDNKNGQILSMVWWRDYFDTDNKWNVNIITSKLQPWSTFKPFVYSLWFLNSDIWTKTPIYDVETEFNWEYIPANFDWKFMWKMNISTALNNSRNIPALKMYVIAWWERKIVDFMKSLWVKSLQNHGYYWAPLSLWTWEMTPLELATAYSVFANMWEKKEITPILKIVDSKWNVIEDNSISTEKEKKQVISELQAYITNSMLSDTSTRPSFWNTYLSLDDRLVWAKTWTSTKQSVKEDGEKDIRPSNLWTAWYTPQITTVVWAWNTSGEKVDYKWNWLEWAWPIWKEFMEFAHKWKEVISWEAPEKLKELNVSEISWLPLNPESENSSDLLKSLFINVPKEYDDSYKWIKVDSLCDWKVTDKTPKAAIKNATLIEFISLIPSNEKWQDPVIEWAKSDEAKEKYGNIENLVTQINDEECKRSWIESDILVRTTTKENDVFVAWENHIELAYRSTNPIIRIDVLIDNSIVDQIKINNKKSWSYVWNIFIPVSKINSKSTLTFRAVDKEYYSSEVNKTILIIKNDILAPKIKLINPIDWSIKLYNTDYFNLKANIEEKGKLRTINIKIDWKLIKSWITDRNIVFPINKNENISIWKHIITIEVIDYSFNKSVKEIKLEVLEK